MGDGREARSVGCAMGAGSSSDPEPTGFISAGGGSWPGRVDRWVLQPRLCGKAGN